VPLVCPHSNNYDAAATVATVGHGRSHGGDRVTAGASVATIARFFYAHSASLGEGVAFILGAAISSFALLVAITKSVLATIHSRDRIHFLSSIAKDLVVLGGIALGIRLLLRSALGIVTLI
jgi:uncharacterized membrane-anchored protein